MKVSDVFLVLSKKSEYWGMRIYDCSGKVMLGECNKSLSFEDIPANVRDSEVKVLASGYGGLVVGVEL